MGPVEPLDELVADVLEDIRKYIGGELQKEESSSSDESTEPSLQKSRRMRNLRRRALSRARTFVAAAIGAESGLSGLELAAVGRKVNEDYVNLLDRFLSWAETEGLALDADDEIDAALVRWFNRLYLLGHLPHVGEKTLAALMHREPHFSRKGRGAIPRAFRALAGWRKKCPSRSRSPLPWAFWTAVACHLAQRNYVLMGVLTLLLVDAYLRPCDAFPLTAGQLLPPAAGISSSWGLLLQPSEAGEVSKTGESDDTVLMDSPHLQWLRPVWETLHDQPPSNLLFPFGYAAFVVEFKKTVRALGVKEAVPYQARHSGPSIDLALRRRDLKSAKKRGRWRTDRSLRRYEKAGRLLRVADRWTAAQRAHFNRSVDLVEGLILGRGDQQLALSVQ